MGARIAIVGTGAVGGYVGAHMAQAGEDVTLVDFWPENVETIRTTGLHISHAGEVAEFTTPARALHVTELQRYSKELPIDIAFICTKSYDTAWATTMVRQYLAPGGFFPAELHQRGDDRGHRRLGEDAGLDRKLNHGRALRAGPRPTRLGQARCPPHRLPRRRGARPCHRSCQGNLPPACACGFRQGHAEPLGRTLDEARRQCHGER